MTWTLHQGDCLDPVTGLASLPDKSVDVVITDPPYEAEAHRDGRRVVVSRGGERSVSDDRIDFHAITATQRADAAAEISRVVRHRAVVFCQAEAIDAWKQAFNAAGLPYRRAIPWTKPDAMPSLHGRWPGQGFEAIVLAQHAGSPPCPIGGKARVYSFVRAQAPDGYSKNPHPTTKPLPLMRQMIEDFTDPGDLILDPFAGSGTTGVAALMLGRRFIGWEKDADYHAIAERRLRGDEAKPRLEQPSLWSTIP